MQKHVEKIVTWMFPFCLVLFMMGIFLPELRRWYLYDPEKEEQKAYLNTLWQDHIDRADEMLQDYEIGDVKRAGALGMKARALIRLGKKDDGISLYEEILQNENAPSLALDCIATSLVDCGYIEEGSKIFEKLLTRFPHHKEVLLRYGTFLVRRSQSYESGLVLLEECKNMEDSGTVNVVLVDAYMAKGRTKDAQRAAKAAMNYPEVCGTRIDYLKELISQ